MNSSSKKSRKLGTLLGAALTAAAAVASLGSTSCKSEQPKFKEGMKFAGGREVTAKELNAGWEAYMLYCYACHGEKGDGRGPSSYGLFPRPRDFTKVIFKFARLRSSDDMPNDADLQRIVLGGLHGTAMLPWDIQESELDLIFQYIKTFNVEKWTKTKKNGDPVPVLPEFDASKDPDPWEGKEEEAVTYGRDLYHFRAECVNCHPAYGTKQELFAWSSAAAKKDSTKFKAVSGFREDIYGSVAKDSTEYGLEVEEGGKKKLIPTRIMPPDFTFTPLRSIRDGSELIDLFRLVSFGVYPVMPAWQGAGLDSRDIWAIAYYVRYLQRMGQENSPELAKMRERIATQPPFEVPKEKAPEPPKEAAPPPAGEAPKDGEAPKPAEGEKKEEKPADKPAEEHH